jgi:hypothetical protein
MGSLLLSADAMAGETPQPTFGPAPAPLAGPELPSFKFSLGSQPTKSVARRRKRPSPSSRSQKSSPAST